MARTTPTSPLVSLPLEAAGVSRRRFLRTLGVLAGAGFATRLAGPGTRRGSATRVDVTRPALGTWVRIVARHHDEAVAVCAVERAFRAIARVDAQMSVHRPDSQLARVNASAGTAAHAVDGAVIEVVTMALEGARRSDGVYDPTVLPLMRLYGFDGGEAAGYPSDAALARTLERVGWRQVTIPPGEGTIGLARAGAGLDLGSIGKGWAVDRAADALKEAGVRDGMVDGGGNVFAFGAPEDGAPGWSVGVLHPATREVDRVFVLRDAAVATSGNTEQYRVLGGLRVGHLFDARRGRPAEGHLSASVQARTATAADLMSTAAFLLGPDRFRWPEAEAVHFVG